MEIENWGYNCENESMKGYVLYAIRHVNLNSSRLKLSNDQIKALMSGLNFATSELTAQEAFDYYNSH